MSEMKRRPSPYVWTTWITGLLAKSEQCQWKVWMKSHFYLPKKQENEESQQRLNKWVKEHNDMTAKRALQMRKQGYLVFVEDENSFNLKGEVATLAGKPDIIAVQNDAKTVLIIDEKSGKPKDQYIWQVLIYMFAKAFVYSDFTISGEIEYKDHVLPIFPRQLNHENKRRIGSIMKIVGGNTEPPRTPSRLECADCTVFNCPDRVVVDEIDASEHF